MPILWDIVFNQRNAPTCPVKVSVNNRIVSALLSRCVIRRWGVVSATAWRERYGHDSFPSSWVKDPCRAHVCQSRKYLANIISRGLWIWWWTLLTAGWLMKLYNVWEWKPESRILFGNGLFYWIQKLLRMRVMEAASQAHEGASRNEHLCVHVKKKRIVFRESMMSRMGRGSSRVYVSWRLVKPPGEYVYLTGVCWT